MNNKIRFEKGFALPIIIGIITLVFFAGATAFYYFQDKKGTFKARPDSPWRNQRIRFY